MEYKSKYFSYLSEVVQMTLTNDMELSAEERLLLEAIAVRQAENKPLIVTECMRYHHLASPATIYRKLEGLRDKQWIHVMHMPDNRKSKYLVLSKRAEDYFDLHHRAIEKVYKVA